MFEESSFTSSIKKWNFSNVQSYRYMIRNSKMEPLNFKLVVT